MADEVVKIPQARFGINEIVYLRESALLGFLEPVRVYNARFDRDVRKIFYRFIFKKAAPDVQTVGDANNLKTVSQTEVIEDELLTFAEALLLKADALRRELAKTEAQLAGVVSGPEIDVFGNEKEIADGDATADSSDFTDFGTAKVASEATFGSIDQGTVVRSFEIRNNGDVDLLLTGNPLVQLVGDDDFTVISQPLPTIPAGTGSVFSISFQPIIVGRRTATVIIASNDDDESTYSFAIEGEGVSA